MAALIVATLGGGYILTADNDDATFETVGRWLSKTDMAFAVFSSA